MISRTAIRTKIIPSRQQRRSHLNRPKTSAIDHAVRVVHNVCCLAGAASLIDDNRADLRAEGIPSAIRRHDTATLFDWLTSALSYQGISDQVASDYMERHGRRRGPISTPRLPPIPPAQSSRATGISTAAGTTKSAGHVQSPTTSTPVRCRPTSYAMVGSTSLFIRDVADGDLVGWIDRQVQDADDPASPNRLPDFAKLWLDRSGRSTGSRTRSWP